MYSIMVVWYTFQRLKCDSFEYLITYFNDSIKSIKQIEENEFFVQPIQTKNYW